MLLAVDVGNSQTALGLYQDEQLADNFRLATDRSRTGDELGVTLSALLDLDAVDGVCLSTDIENYTVFDVSNALRERGWQVPAYTFPKNREDLAALRVVVRRGFTHDLADLLVADLQRQLPRLEAQPAPVHDATTATAFAH